MSETQLRVAITVDPELPVPPKHYGGIERIVDMLVSGLVDRGHVVTLFANAASRVACNLEAYPAAQARGARAVLQNSWFLRRRLANQQFDVLHSFGRLAYLLPLIHAPLPKIMSYQRQITIRNVEAAKRLGRGTIQFTGCSRHLIRFWEGCSDFHVIYNGVAADRYKPRFAVCADSPLVFLGRIESIKGVHLAIDVARRSGRELVIAGNVPNSSQHRRYFDEMIQPHVDGHRIRYMGAVDDTVKEQLLGEAAALLMPILWDEPFGIVMAEALACGTPVIALSRGSVPEIVEDGVNGFVCRTPDEMVDAVARLNSIDRRVCRSIMEQRFSDSVITDEYEQLYRRVAVGTQVWGT